MPITGLLRPATNSRDAWLFPVMSAPWRHGLGDPEQPWHYPKPLMTVDAEDLQTVFDDDVLHCVCSHLCCDRQVVHVNGSHSYTLDDEEVVNLFHGHRRNYGLHLELRPASGRCQLKVTMEQDHTADLSAGLKPREIDLRCQIAILKNIHGVIFRDFDFTIAVVIKCASADRDKVNFRVQSLLECVTGCQESAFVNCTATITVEVHNLNARRPIHFYSYNFPYDREEDRSPRWQYGGGSGGGGGGGGYGGGVGWGGGGYQWPDEDEEDDKSEGEDQDEQVSWLPFGNLDVLIRAIAFHNCPRAVFARGCQALLNLSILSQTGAESVAIGWQNCGGWHNQRSSGKIINNVQINGAGQSYTADDGSHGVFPYSVTARAESRLLSASGGGHIRDLTGSATAIARATAANQPYHTNAQGNTSHSQVGGASRALAFGLLNNQGGKITAANVTCLARATHPNSQAALAIPYRTNSATLRDCTGSEPYCSSNLPQWCQINQ